MNHDALFVIDFVSYVKRVGKRSIEFLVGMLISTFGANGKWSVETVGVLMGGKKRIDHLLCRVVKRLSLFVGFPQLFEGGPTDVENPIIRCSGSLVESAGPNLGNWNVH